MENAAKTVWMERCRTTNINKGPRDLHQHHAQTLNRTIFAAVALIEIRTDKSGRPAVGSILQSLSHALRSPLPICRVIRLCCLLRCYLRFLIPL
jgi:hypothetical protein